MRKIAAVLASSAALALAAPTVGEHPPPTGRELRRHRHQGQAQGGQELQLPDRLHGRLLGHGAGQDPASGPRHQAAADRGSDPGLRPRSEASRPDRAGFQASLIANVGKAKLKGTVTGIDSATGAQQVVPFRGLQVQTLAATGRSTGRAKPVATCWRRCRTDASTSPARGRYARAPRALRAV